MDVIVAAALGFVAGGGAVWLLGRRGSGTTFLIAKRQRSIAPLRRSPQQLPPTELERLIHNAGQLAAIDGSALRQVIGMGRSSVANGVTVELIAIEVREAGCRCLLRFRLAGAEMDGELYRPVGSPEVTVVDDLSTRYETGMADISQSGTGGEASFHFAPPPPADARRLTIVIKRFEEPRLPPERSPSSPGGDTPGPWTFDVETRGTASEG